MKNNRKTFLKRIKNVTTVFALLFTIAVNAQQPAGPPSLGGQSDSNVLDNRSSNSVPLDGGLGILLAGAAFFGIKKLRAKKNS